jgi:holliday junction DNA helicase RuvA
MMYEYLRGRLIEAGEVTILEVAGVGYKLGVPRLVATRLPAVGQELLLYVTVITRETGQTLYGFRTRDERALFELLLTLSGVGPKIALGVLSHLSPAQLHSAVTLGDEALLKKIPGIGKKVAERLLIELRDKLPDLSDEEAVLAAPQTRLVADALKALLQLGFAPGPAQKMLQEVTTQQPAINDLPTLLSAALRRSGS